MTSRASAVNKEEKTKTEEEEFSTGPLSVLTQSVKMKTQVLINCRNNKKLLGRVKCALWQPPSPSLPTRDRPLSPFPSPLQPSERARPPSNCFTRPVSEHGNSASPPSLQGL